MNWLHSREFLKFVRWSVEINNSPSSLMRLPVCHVILFTNKFSHQCNRCIVTGANRCRYGIDEWTRTDEHLFNQFSFIDSCFDVTKFIYKFKFHSPSIRINSTLFTFTMPINHQIILKIAPFRHSYSEKSRKSSLNLIEMQTSRSFTNEL